MESKKLPSVQCQIKVTKLLESIMVILNSFVIDFHSWCHHQLFPPHSLPVTLMILWHNTGLQAVLSRLLPTYCSHITEMFTVKIKRNIACSSTSSVA